MYLIGPHDQFCNHWMAINATPYDKYQWKIPFMNGVLYLLINEATWVLFVHFIIAV